MKTQILKMALLGLLIFPHASFSQNEPNDEPGPAMIDKQNREKLKSMKIAYLTEKMALSPEEAKVFWPVYDDFHKKKLDLRQEHRKKMKAAKEKSKLSTQEMEQIVDAELAMKTKLLEIDKEYHAKLKTILPIEKVMKYYEAEHGFKREMMKKMKKNYHNPPPAKENDPTLEY